MLDKMPAPSFRTSVGGYNKDDINNYIRETNASFLASSKEYEERIRELRTTVAQRDRTIAELREKLDGADGKEVAELLRRNSELSDALSHLGEENHRAQERIEALERENAALKAAEANAPETESAVQERLKAEAYDKVSAQIGRIMLEARENAESVIADAQSEADVLREEAQNCLSQARTESDELRRKTEEDCRRAQERLKNIGTAFGCSVDDMAGKIEHEVGRVIGDVCGLLRSAAAGADDEISGLSHKLGSECGKILENALRNAKREASSVTGAPAEDDHVLRRDGTGRPRTEQLREDRTRTEQHRDDFRRSAARPDSVSRNGFLQREKKL